MTIFICVFVFSLIIFYIWGNNKKSLFFSILLLALLASLRKYTVGIDTSMYYDSFYAIGKSNWRFDGFRYEYLYLVLNKVLYIIFRSPQSLIIVTSVFINFSMYIFIKDYSNDYRTSFIIYFLLNIYFSYLNVMRQALCISIFLLSLKFLLKKKYLVYYLMVFISSLFHISGIIYALIPFIVYFYRHNRKIFMVVLFLLFLICFVFIKNIFVLFCKIVGESYLGYLDSQFSNSNFFGSLLDFLLNLFIIFCASYGQKKKSTSVFFILSFIYILVVALVMRMNIFNRISILFQPAIIIYASNSLLDEKRGKLSFQIMIVVLILSFLVINGFRPEWTGAIPYSFFWER